MWADPSVFCLEISSAKYTCSAITNSAFYITIGDSNSAKSSFPIKQESPSM